MSRTHARVDGLMGAANAPPPPILCSAWAPPVPLSFLGGMERRETPGGLRGPPWGNLGSANPAPGRSRAPTGRDCEFRPRDAPSEIPSGCEPGGKARKRLPALHRERPLSDRRSRSSVAPRHDRRREPLPDGWKKSIVGGLLSRTDSEQNWVFSCLADQPIPPLPFLRCRHDHRNS